MAYTLWPPARPLARPSESARQGETGKLLNVVAPLSPRQVCATLQAGETARLRANQSPLETRTLVLCASASS